MDTRQSTIANLVVYTAIFENYDELRDLPRLDAGTAGICFTDDGDLKSETWEVRCIELEAHKSSGFYNRYYKMNPHLIFPDNDISLYIDGNIELVSDPSSWYKNILINSDIAITRHPERDCVYDEVESCKSHSLIDEFQAERWKAVYLEADMPRHHGLFENNVILRRHHSPEVIRLMSAWWSQYINFGGRDQLSLAWLARREGVKITPILDGPRVSHSHFRMHDHALIPKSHFIQRLYKIVKIRKRVNQGYGLLYRILSTNLVERILYRIQAIFVPTAPRPVANQGSKNNSQ